MTLISKQQLGQLHGLLGALQLTSFKADIVASASNGRTESSKELYFTEAVSLIANLREKKKAKFGPMRKKVIHQCCMMGMVDDGDRPDYVRINKFVKGIGKRNPKKKELNQLNWKELIAVTTQVEAVYVKSLK